MEHSEEILYAYFTKVNHVNTFVIYKCYEIGHEIAVKM